MLLLIAAAATQEVLQPLIRASEKERRSWATSHRWPSFSCLLLFPLSCFISLIPAHPLPVLPSSWRQMRCEGWLHAGIHWSGDKTGDSRESRWSLASHGFIYLSNHFGKVNLKSYNIQIWSQILSKQITGINCSGNSSLQFSFLLTSSWMLMSSRSSILNSSVITSPTLAPQITAFIALVSSNLTINSCCRISKEPEQELKGKNSSHDWTQTFLWLPSVENVLNLGSREPNYPMNP